MLFTLQNEKMSQYKSRYFKANFVQVQDGTIVLVNCLPNVAASVIISQPSHHHEQSSLRMNAYD